MLLAVQTKVIQNRFRCNASDCNLNYLPLAATSVCTEDFNNSVGWQAHTHNFKENCKFKNKNKPEFSSQQLRSVFLSIYLPLYHQSKKPERENISSESVRCYRRVGKLKYRRVY
ncbi:hypothetical protein GQX74_004257 [Glossina fuscipes]|nr:hypothetical protein GQX74_004257 [Glossina fuscipes]